MGKILLITGGARSGKSTYAEKTALGLSANPVYVATARRWDDEFQRRIEHHRAMRGPQWDTIEENKYISGHDVNGRVVVIDCVTLWCTNFFYDNNGDVNKSLKEMKSEFDTLTDQNATFIFVTNEIGMGGTSTNEVQRKFTDLQGWFNQYVASKASEVTMMVSGISIRIK